MIAISDFMGSLSMVYVIMCIAATIFCMHYYCTIIQGKKKWNAIIDRIPFIGGIMWQYHMCQVLQALALLVASGVPLVAALKIVSESIDHELVKIQLQG